jgi:hypothetical protein
MKIKDKVYCTSIGVYSSQLTKRKSYIIEGTNSDSGNIRICNDENKLKWYSKFYFSSDKEPEITSIHIDDKIMDPESDDIEVTITFSNNDRYWLTFTTPKYLESILETAPYIPSSHFLIVKNLSEEIINDTIHKLDDQNELISNCKKY